MRTEAEKNKHREYMREYRKTHPEKRNPEKSREGARRYYRQHKDEAIERQRNWRENNPEKKLAQDRRYRKKNGDSIRRKGRKRYARLSPEEKLALSLKQQCRFYGITVADYYRMVKEQNGCCATCGEPPSRWRLDIDHNHSSGQVRGLLCRRCNLAVGLFEGDGEELVHRILSYIQRTLA